MSKTITTSSANIAELEKAIPAKNKSPRLKKPSMFEVIYHNDDTTTRDFVITSLMSNFDYDENRAISATDEIHNNGSKVVAVLPYELAEQKKYEVEAQARAELFTLKVSIRPEKA